jgi:uncharacterized membrane protein
MTDQPEQPPASIAPAAQPPTEEVRRELEKQLEPKLSKLDVSVRHEIVDTAVRVAVRYTSPVPPPEGMEAWERLEPGAAGRILTMAENTLEHNQQMERLRLTLPAVLDGFGTLLGSIVTMFTIGAAVYCIVNGYQITGLSIFGATLAGIVGAIIRGRSQVANNNSEPPAPQKRRQRSRR